MAAFSSSANRTNRNRDQASTAQNTCSPASDTPVDDQRVTRRPHRRPAAAVMTRRHAAFASATSRRKFRADPAYPAARAAGSSRFAEIRPCASFDPLRDQLGDRVVVVAPVLPLASAARRPRAPPRSASPSCASCRRSPRHPDSCPPLGRRQSRPSVPSRSSMEVPCPRCR